MHVRGFPLWSAAQGCCRALNRASYYQLDWRPDPRVTIRLTVEPLQPGRDPLENRDHGRASAAFLFRLVAACACQPVRGHRSRRESVTIPAECADWCACWDGERV